jgi:hypothetical protein
MFSHILEGEEILDWRQKRKRLREQLINFEEIKAIFISA